MIDRHGIVVLLTLVTITPFTVGHEGQNHSSTAEANAHMQGADSELPYAGVRPVAWIVYGFLVLVVATTVIALIRYRRERQRAAAQHEQARQSDDR